jgi:hypothetical protein
VSSNPSENFSDGCVQRTLVSCLLSDFRRDFGLRNSQKEFLFLLVFDGGKVALEEVNESLSALSLNDSIDVFKSLLSCFEGLVSLELH